MKRLESRGIATRTLIAGTGIQRSDLNKADFSPSPTQYRQIFRAIVARAAPGIGLDLGLEATIADEGVLGYAALSSAKMRDVNALMKKYSPLVDPFVRFSDEVRNGLWHIEFTALFPMGDVLPFVMEEICARAKVEFKAYTGVDVPFKMLELEYPAPSYAQRYQEIFDCPVHFLRPRNRIILAAKYLDAPIVLSNPEVASLCERQCAIQLGAEKSKSIGAEIRRRLLMNPGKYASLAEMSAALRLSVTSVKRKLAAEGMTYQEILNLTRQDLAIQYLQETSLTPKEISYRLGFSNVHNFRRAFKSWTGVNPSHFQRR